jgi:hypothetical protein
MVVPREDRCRDSVPPEHEQIDLVLLRQANQLALHVAVTQCESDSGNRRPGEIARQSLGESSQIMVVLTAFDIVSARAVILPADAFDDVK